MNIVFSSSRYVINIFKDQIFRTLTDQQKRIAAIVSITLSCVVFIRVLKRYSFTSKPSQESSKLKDLRTKTFSSDKKLEDQEKNTTLKEEKIPSITGITGGLIFWELKLAENVFLAFNEEQLSQLSFSPKEKQEILNIYKDFLQLTKPSNSYVKVTVYKNGDYRQEEPGIAECLNNGCHFFTSRVNSGFGSYYSQRLGLSMDFVKQFDSANQVDKKALLSKLVEEMKDAIHALEKKK